MYRGSRILLAAACATVVGLLSVPDAGRAQDRGPVYNPYPPGILPDDLNSEIRRVRREVRGIFREAFEESRALPPLTFSNTQATGNPPTLEGTGYQAIQTLGKLLLFDGDMRRSRR